MSTDKDKAEQARRDADPNIRKCNDPKILIAYARSIAIALNQTHYRDVREPFVPYEDLSGLLEQIDNMAAGLARKLSFSDAQPKQSGWYWATNDKFTAVVRVDDAPHGFFCAWHTRVDQSNFCAFEDFPKSQWSAIISEPPQ